MTSACRCFWKSNAKVLLFLCYWRHILCYKCAKMQKGIKKRPRKAVFLSVSVQICAEGVFIDEPSEFVGQSCA